MSYISRDHTPTGSCLPYCEGKFADYFCSVLAVFRFNTMK